MNNNLYFISVFEAAFQQPDAGKALEKAIEHIITMGQLPEYEQGFLQFDQFMNEVKRNFETRLKESENTTLSVFKDLSLQLAAGILEEDQKELKKIMDVLASKPEWKDEFNKIPIEMSESETHTGKLELIIERNGYRFGTVPLDRLPFKKDFTNMKPGKYVVKLNSGRIIWQEELFAEDLLWTYAFPQQALDMAASTWDTTMRATRVISLLEGEIIMRIFPELEHGRLEIEIKGSDDE